MSGYKVMTLDEHGAFIGRLRAGGVSADAVREAYRRFWRSRRDVVEEIKARYSTKELKARLWLPVSYHKNGLAKEYYDQLADQYTMACPKTDPDPESVMGGMTLNDRREMRLAELTDDQIAAHADKLARRHAAAARSAAEV